MKKFLIFLLITILSCFQACAVQQWGDNYNNVSIVDAVGQVTYYSHVYVIERYTVTDGVVVVFRDRAGQQWTVLGQSAVIETISYGNTNYYVYPYAYHYRTNWYYRDHRWVYHVPYHRHHHSIPPPPPRHYPDHRTNPGPRPNHPSGSSHGSNNGYRPSQPPSGQPHRTTPSTRPSSPNTYRSTPSSGHTARPSTGSSRSYSSPSPRSSSSHPSSQSRGGYRR